MGPGVRHGVRRDDRVGGRNPQRGSRIQNIENNPMQSSLAIASMRDP